MSDTKDVPEGSEDSKPMLCKCGEETRKLTVKKEGKNQGRIFYQCSKFQGKCGFMVWDDELKKEGKEPSPDAIVCKCNNEARRLTVKKEGKNQGRAFYQCTKWQGKCGFHQWEDELKKNAPKNNTKDKSESDKDSEGSDDSDGSESDSDSQKILCKCGEETRKLTVKKEGKNQGRVFYQCTKFKGKCGFFKWDDELKKNGHPTGQKRKELELDDDETPSAKK